jgi:hypothetical protein
MATGGASCVRFRLSKLCAAPVTHMASPSNDDRRLRPHDITDAPRDHAEAVMLIS